MLCVAYDCKDTLVLKSSARTTSNGKDYISG